MTFAAQNNVLEIGRITASQGVEKALVRVQIHPPESVMRQAFVEAVTLVVIERFVPIARVRYKGETVLGRCEVHAEVEARIRASLVAQRADLGRSCDRTLATQQWQECNAARRQCCCCDAANLQE